MKREAKITASLKRHPDLTLRDLTPFVYDEVDKKLHHLAERSLLAHLLKLQAEGSAIQDNRRWRLATR
jgi:hypothetical protein